jgi:phasin
MIPPEMEGCAMADIAATTTAKPKAKPAIPAFEMPKFEMPKFEIPKMEVPAAFREIAEKGVSQAKENYEKMKAAAEEATDMLEDTYSTASKGAADYGLKLIEVARANTNAAFDFANDLINVKSLAEVVELTTTHSRKQFEAMSGQVKELATLAQKVATDTAEPIKSGVNKALKTAS